MRARSDLMAYCLAVDPEYQSPPPRHLEYIAGLLAQVERYIETGGREGIGRLILNMPPRHGKSLTITKRWPAYLLSRHRKWHLGIVSYGQEFAQDFSASIRATLQSDDAQAVWVGHPEGPPTIDRAFSALERWSLDQSDGNSPSLVSTSFGGVLTGRGFQLLIIDDPVKSRAEAESPANRRYIAEAYAGTLRTRLEPGGAIVICTTRWHQGDLCGYLVDLAASGGGEAWEVVNLPAIAEEADPMGREPGAPLWPERFPLASYAPLQLNAYEWASQYMGRPSPRGGGLIQREWFDIVDAAQVPRGPGVRRVRYWDLAATEQTDKSKDPDFTAGALVVEKGGRYWVADLRADRLNPQRVEALIRQTAQMDGPTVPIYIEREGGASGKSVVLHYQRTVLKGFPVYPDTPGTSKVARSTAFRAAAERGDVALVRAPWNEAFLAEAEQFPAGNHDDRVDSVVGAFNKVNLTPGAFAGSSYAGEGE